VLEFSHCISPHASKDKWWHAGGVAGSSGRRPSHLNSIAKCGNVHNFPEVVQK
jgi:hypothetical protein